MNIKGPKDDSYDVSDSTDWLGTPLASLGDVDSLLRCQVCKDFFTTPMITSCAHTFCSLCIRRCLNNDSKCPTCRSTDQEIKLKSNGVVEDLVDAFKRARPAALELARKPAVELTLSSPKRKREVSNLDDYDGQTNKRTRASTRRATREAQVVEQEEIVIIEDDKEDDDFVPDGLAECPVCERRMTAKDVEAHIGRCLAETDNSTRPTSSLSRSTFISSAPKPTQRPERLPHINFDMIKEAALRKKLSDLGLPTGGGKATMVKRMTEYMTIWNANCDAKNPRNKSQLKKDLDVWERTHGSRAPAPNGLSAQIKDKSFDGAAWATTHKNNYDDLITQARQKIKSQAPKSPEKNLASSPSIPMASSQGSKGEVNEEQQINIPRYGMDHKEDPIPLTSSPSRSSQLGSQRRFFSESRDPIPGTSMAGASSQPNRTVPVADSGTEIINVKPVQP